LSDPLRNIAATPTSDDAQNDAGSLSSITPYADPNSTSDSGASPTDVGAGVGGGAPASSATTYVSNGVTLTGEVAVAGLAAAATSPGSSPSGSSVEAIGGTSDGTGKSKLSSLDIVCESLVIDTYRKTYKSQSLSPAY